MKIRVLIFFILAGILGSCSDKNDDATEQVEYVEPMLYSIDLMMQANEGSSDESIVTRGVNYVDSYFTNQYEGDYIYVHSADNYNDDRHQVLQVPIEPEVLACDSCGIHLQIDVKADNSYTITSGENSINISRGGEVYFSNLPTPYWEAEVKEKASPITHNYDIFVRSEEKNIELLRSRDDYSLNELLQIAVDNPRIPLGRHCTGFRANVMFSSYPGWGTNYTLEIDQFYYLLSQDATIQELGLSESDYTLDHFYIKLFVGPWFAQTFDMFNRSVPENDEGGYYVSGYNLDNQNTYKPFSFLDYSYHKEPSGENPGGAALYSGIGYRTETEEILLAPMNLNITGSQIFTVYVFVKYVKDNSNVDLVSDANSFYFDVQLSSLSTTPNIIHRAVLVFSYEELVNIIKWTLNPDTFPTSESSSQTLTRGLSSSDSPKRIDAEPLQIYSALE